MGFECELHTRERLEWSRLLEHLASHAATERGAAACREERLAPDAVAIRERLAETSEARALMDAGEAVPFGGVSDLRPLLGELARGRTPEGRDLIDVLECARAARRVRGFLAERRQQAPGLAALAETMVELRPLEDRLESALTPEGEVRDAASKPLASARREARRLEGEIERRMAGYLRDPQVEPHLQDNYSTFREGRPVLPIRADARRQVPGILHDVSSSGTTVFIEPEAVVEAGNRLRLARTEERHEVERVLGRLGAAVTAESLELEAQGGTLCLLDCAVASGRLSQRLDASAPEVDDDAPLALRALRHPLLALEGGIEPDRVVANDLELPENVRGLVISGPNAGGKTVLAKALGLAALAIRSGLHVACAPGSRMPAFEAVFADIGDEQDLRAGLSSFSGRMAQLARILDRADSRTLVILDEVGEGTEPGEGAALAQATLEALVERGATVVATTHFNRLKELAGSDDRFANASAEFDAETLLPTYRVHMGVPGSSGATWVAERMGLGADVVERSRALLDRDDRRLESLARGLSELRQQLEAERQLATEARAQTETARAEYEARLSQLRGAREQALAAIKADLETAYRSARQEIARAVRELQRGEGNAGRAANRARTKLDQVRATTESVERAHAPKSAPGPAGTTGPAEVDWSAAQPGARVQVEGVRGGAVLVELPDRRGRVVVRVGGARVTIPVSRVSGLEPTRVDVAQRGPSREPDRGAALGDHSPVLECDLRGLRVDEALDRAQHHIDRALGTGRAVRLIHGHGTGALRGAVRAWLRDVPYVTDFKPGGESEGGNGVTIATLSH